MVGLGEVGILDEGPGGELSGEGEEPGVGEEFVESEGCLTALHAAKEVARAASAQVFFGDLESVGGLLEYGEFLAGFFVVFIDEQDAIGGVGAASDATAELMELGEAEAGGVMDDHDGGVGDVDADFDDGGGDEGLDFVVTKLAHDGVLGFGIDAAVEESDVVFFEAFAPGGVSGDGGAGVEFFGFFDERMDDVSLAALVELGFEEGGDVLEFGGVADGRDDFATFARAFVDGGDIEVAVEREGERARDGGGGHDEHIGDGVALGDESGALGDAEFVLFVDDGEAELRKADAVVEKGVGADENVGKVFGELVVGFWGARGVRRDRQDVCLTHRQNARVTFIGGAEGHTEAEGGEPALGVLIVLLGKDLGGSHEGGLMTGFDGDEHGGEGNDGFAAADIAVKESVHGDGISHVLADLVETAELGGGEVEGEVLKERLKEVAGRFLGIAAMEPVLMTMMKQAQLEEIKLFEGEVTSGLGESVEVGGMMEGLNGFGTGVAGEFAGGLRRGQEVGEGGGVEVLEEMPEGGAQGFLFEVAAQSVDGDDATGVDAGRGGIGVFFEEDFVVGVVDDETALYLFDFAVDDEVHVDGKGALHEGHAEPAEGQLVLAEAGACGNRGGFEHGAATEAQESGAEDAQVMADGVGVGMKAGEGELPAVFVPGGENVEEVGGGFDAFADEKRAGGGGDDEDFADGGLQMDACGLWHWRNGGRMLG